VRIQNDREFERRVCRNTMNRGTSISINKARRPETLVGGGNPCTDLPIMRGTLGVGLEERNGRQIDLRRM
jgi:hypothetical protein